MCRPKAIPPWAASTGQCSSCHCCSTCGARARLGQHHAGECGTRPAAHQAAWQVAGMHNSIECCRKRTDVFLPACTSRLCWGAGLCSRQTAEQACRFIWNGGCDYLPMRERDCCGICMQLLPIGQHLDSTQAFHLHKLLLTLNLPPTSVHAESIV